MCRGSGRVCQKKMREIIAKDKEASAVEQDMLTTLEVCYEFYLRGFTFRRMDIYQSDAIHFKMDLENNASSRPLCRWRAWARRRPCPWPSSGRGRISSPLRR